ncbi:hypothetical protein AURDEDRAFT_117937 [Auricularia subglabra TFB-10046 SS5]|uniref:BTB domain-containing protein n=1 Tax=Auricularia subglabra (strain TFB-10046 / SS5) TaxID=717982 RepID=J0CS61_AURST|nr:hypothetical protein AURDEDRAFT_117937 [Auricularia subglabra TFB-10046 SS5]
MSEPGTPSCAASANVLLKSVICDLKYREPTVQLKVGDNVYKISKSRLSLRSPFFRGLFARLKDGSEDRPPIQLDISEPEWKAFVWFIHVDPLALEIHSAAPASTENCALYLGVVISGLHFGARDVAGWAIDRALGMLTQPARNFPVDLELARLLVSVASRWRGGACDPIITTCRDLVCDALHPNRLGELSDDPIRALTIARVDKFVLSHVYFYILNKGTDYNWKDDARVEPVDRIRLLCGAYSLSHQNTWAISTAFSQSSSSSTSASWTVSSLFALAIGPTVATQFTQPSGVTAQGRQAPLQWRPEIDRRIMCARDRLWNHFDDKQWSLAM